MKFESKVDAKILVVHILQNMQNVSGQSTLWFCRGRLKSIPIFKTAVHSNCSARTSFVWCCSRWRRRSCLFKHPDHHELQHHHDFNLYANHRHYLSSYLFYFSLLRNRKFSLLLKFVLFYHSPPQIMWTGGKKIRLRSLFVLYHNYYVFQFSERNWHVNSF